MMPADEEQKYRDHVASELRSLKAELEANTVATSQIREIMGTAKGFFTVINWVGRIVIWCATVVGAGYGVYSLVRDFVVKRPPV